MTDPLTYRVIRNVCKSHRLVCAIYLSLQEMQADHDYVEQKSKSNPKYMSLLIQIKNDLTACTQMLRHTIEMN